jgi:membrane-associated protein
VDFLLGVAFGHYSLDDLIRWGGYTILFVIVFVETGLFAFLPGDSLLIAAGLVASAGHLNIWWLNVLLSVAAVAGDNVGYAIGVRVGPRIFTRAHSRVFNPRHLEHTRQFYAKYGAKTIVIARFVPIVRTFAPIVAGVGQMPYRRFVFYNVAGGVGWVVSMTWTGYLLGQMVPNIERHVHIVVIVVIVLSLVPIGVEWWRARARAKAGTAVSEP